MVVETEETLRYFITVFDLSARAVILEKAVPFKVRGNVERIVRLSRAGRLLVAVGVWGAGLIQVFDTGSGKSCFQTRGWSPRFLIPGACFSGSGIPASRVATPLRSWFPKLRYGVPTAGRRSLLFPMISAGTLVDRSSPTPGRLPARTASDCFTRRPMTGERTGPIRRASPASITCLGSTCHEGCVWTWWITRTEVRKRIISTAQPLSSIDRSNFCFREPARS